MIRSFWKELKKTVFGKTPPTIDLISIGIVDENGREYYAISKDFNLKEAWNRYDIKANFGKPQGFAYEKVYWIRENVLKPIFKELQEKELQEKGGNFVEFCYTDLKNLINKYGLHKQQIAFEVLNFTHGYDDIGNWLGSIEEYFNSLYKIIPEKEIEFYAYYASYDWVAFCWIFGKMMDLPKGFPMYCRDLKQLLDEKAESFTEKGFTTSEKVSLIKTYADYPTQDNEHNALDDARWNLKLYKFLQTIK